MNTMPSSGFLLSILHNMDTLTAPCFSPFQSLQDDEMKQFSPFLNLPNNVIDNIVSYIPLKVRTLVALVCRALRDSVYRSINSVAFYKTQLDELSDTRIKYFLSIHGPKITAINFDLFRSVKDEACTQWSWRQSVITVVKMCTNLRELEIVICKRHRLRDTDLLTIFRECPQLQVLCIDAQYLSGHCFQVAPVGLIRLELEMCLRLSEISMRYIFSRLKKLKVLYLSELKILSDQIISGLVSNMKNLRDLSIIGSPSSPNLELSASALGHLARLPCLQNLCLEGIPAVTDRFLAELSDTVNNPAARSITSLSLAFCFNFSSVGLQRLKRMTKLDSLNLDGITKRDISSGVLKIAEEGRLVRLLLAEGTSITTDALREVVRVSPRLRLLDISNNDVLENWETANSLVDQWVSSRRPSLTILTNNHLPWSMIRMPPPCSPWIPPPVSVVHLHRNTVTTSEVVLGSVLSQEDSSQLPHGLLLPRIRRGNRYRLLCSLLSLSQDLTDNDEQKEKENSSHPLYQLLDSQKSPGSTSNIASMSMISNASIPLIGVQHGNTTRSLGAHTTEFSQLIDPDMALETWMTLLSEDQSYDSLALPFADSLSLLTSGSAGAPRPPFEIPQQPRIHYTRGPRNKRRLNQQKRSIRTTLPPVLFNSTDFPPLQ